LLKYIAEQAVVKIHSGTGDC